jgi:hypothetical protein
MFVDGMVSITDASTIRSPLDASNTQLAVHDSVVALTHPASAARMIGGRARFPNVVGDLLFVYDVQTRPYLLKDV